MEEKGSKRRGGEKERGEEGKGGGAGNVPTFLEGGMASTSPMSFINFWLRSWVSIDVFFAFKHCVTLSQQISQRRHASQ